MRGYLVDTLYLLDESIDNILHFVCCLVEPTLFLEQPKMSFENMLSISP